MVSYSKRNQSYQIGASSSSANLAISGCHSSTPIPFFISEASLFFSEVIWTDGSAPFLFGKSGFGVLANCSVYGTEATLFFSAGPVCSSFSAKFSMHFAGLGSTNQPAISFLFSSFLTFALTSHPALFSVFLLSESLWQELCSLCFCTIRQQWVPGHSLSLENDVAYDVPGGERYSCSLQLHVVSLLLSFVHSCLFSDWRSTVSSKYFDTQVFLISTEELVLSLVFVATDTAYC